MTSMKTKRTKTSPTSRPSSANPTKTSSLLKKVFEVSLWATLIQDPSARRTKDSQPSGFGFEYCASHVRFRVFQQTANLNVSQIWVSVASSAAWATRNGRCQSGHQPPSHRCNRVRNVAFRPQRRILWPGNLRVRQIAGRAWWHDLLRGESFLVRKSGSRMPQCKGWRDGGSHAIPVLQNLPGRPPA